MDLAATCNGARTTVGAADFALAAQCRVIVGNRAAARLEPEPTITTEAIRRLGPEDRANWHLERARLGETRNVAVELLVDRSSAESRTMTADGQIRRLEFAYTPTASCWLALRIRGAVHTNSIGVTVAGAPVRVARIAAWCRRPVDQRWREKAPRIRESERAAEAANHDAAQTSYDRVLDSRS